MKKLWEDPQIYVQEFVANEYVAACGDKGTHYKFSCNVGNFKDLYQETNGIPGLQVGPNGDTRLLSGRSNMAYKGCRLSHDANMKDPFVDGYIVTQDGRGNLNSTEVKIWEERVGRRDILDYHATTNVNMAAWEITKS
ncbi:hypothetical protein P261_00906 [Lachnospiraceae bacterium TWA4]|nr:hypothetical protein P261_00906 [Lachnospiraceae bacterium TWA4]